MEIKKDKPLWHGIVLVAGGAVGAGMFALPIVSSGAWFVWSVLAMALVWWFTYIAAKLLIDTNLRFPLGSSFDTIVRASLGARWAALNNLSIAFIMYILMYAYITAGAGILQFSLSSSIGSSAEVLPSRAVLSLVFAASIALLVWLGTSVVSRISTALMVCMGASFVTANSGLLANAQWSTLIQQNQSEYVVFVGASLPVFVTAFACAGLVPSLVKHYADKPIKVYRSVLWGSALSLCVYILWVCATMGNISREEFASVVSSGGDLQAIVTSLQAKISVPSLASVLKWFSHFAVITSFLSVALGLAHFLRDRFSFSDGKQGKLNAVALAFVPPVCMSIFAPYGFVKAIGYAGLFVAFSFFIVPAMMHLKVFDNQENKVLAGLVIIFGVLIVLLKIGLIGSLLPVYPSS